VFPLLRNNGAISSLQLLRFTCGLHGSLCTLQLFRSTFSFPVSSITATLDMGGWLDLAQ